MSLKLPPDLERRVQAVIDSGAYDTVAEMIRDGLELLLEAEETRQRRLERLRREIQEGIDQLDRGEYVDGEEFLKELRQTIAEMERPPE